MTLTLEPGKYYKMRNGEKVYIQTLHIDKDRGRKKFVSSCGHKVFAENGDNLDWNDDMAMKQTIISEWSEPERIKGYVCIYDRNDGCGSVFGSLSCDMAEAKSATFCWGVDGNELQKIAILEIDIPVGHGIEKEE